MQKKLSEGGEFILTILFLLWMIYTLIEPFKGSVIFLLLCILDEVSNKEKK